MTASTLKIKKQPSETRLITIKFGDKMVTGESILTIDSVTSSPSGLTFTDAAIDSTEQAITVLVGGGEVPTRPDIQSVNYKITAVVTTDADQVLEIDSILIVEEE